MTAELALTLPRPGSGLLMEPDHPAEDHVGQRLLADLRLLSITEPSEGRL